MTAPTPTPAHRYSAPPSVAAQIASLPTLPMADIKALWQQLFSTSTPTHNRQYLERRIAYRLQEVEFRKVNPDLLERNQRRIAALIETGKVKKGGRDYRPVAGTVLTREYQGIEDRVIACADGQYEFQGQAYPSLSRVAREITGTRWSGPVFFGLKAASTPKAQAKKGARR